MGAETLRFFDSLTQRGREPRLEKVRGSLRFDLQENGDTHHWMVFVNQRDGIQVCREEGAADAVISTSPALFDEIVSGRQNSIAAMLRGDMRVTGDLRLILWLERLLPGPPAARGPRRVRREQE